MFRSRTHTLAHRIILGGWDKGQAGGTGTRVCCGGAAQSEEETDGFEREKAASRGSWKEES